MLRGGRRRLPRGGTARRSRPPVAFVAWSTIAGRSAEIAAELGGEARCFQHPRLSRRCLLPLRYLISAGETAAYLGRRRPLAVIATNPPIFPGLIAFAYGRVSGAKVLLDSHPGGFGAQGDELSRRLQPLHRWLARRVTSVLVSTEEWVEVVRKWGGVADVLHEATPLWTAIPRARRGIHASVLYVTVFQRDEPVLEVIGAARALPKVEFRITGDLTRAPKGIRRDAPSNVIFTGFLRGDEYARALQEADVVVALTTEPTSIMRAAYEAVHAQRPLVLSNWPALRETFSHAEFVSNDARGIAAGLCRVLGDYDRFCAPLAAADAAQRRRSSRQLDGLRARLGTSVGYP